MAKLNKVEANAPATEEATMNGIFVPTENFPSLNQLAIVLGIPAVRLQSAQVAYKPIEGQPYSAKAINWASVSAFIERRLDKTDYDSVEAVYAAALATEYTPKRGGGRVADPNSTYGKVLFGTIPVRKGNVKVGDKIYKKKDGSEYEVIFVTDTLVAYKATGDVKAADEAIGNRMFNMNFSLEPVAMQEKIEDAE